MDFVFIEQIETERFREKSPIRVDLFAMPYGRDEWELWWEHYLMKVSSQSFDFVCAIFKALGL